VNDRVARSVSEMDPYSPAQLLTPMHDQSLDRLDHLAQEAGHGSIYDYLDNVGNWQSRLYTVIWDLVTEIFTVGGRHYNSTELLRAARAH
jgi:hypothetical protein